MKRAESAAHPVAGPRRHEADPGRSTGPAADRGFTRPLSPSTASTQQWPAVAHSPALAGQRTLVSSLSASPRLVAQRVQLRATFGHAVQGQLRSASGKPAHAQVISRKIDEAQWEKFKKSQARDRKSQYAGMDVHAMSFDDSLQVYATSRQKYQSARVKPEKPGLPRKDEHAARPPAKATFLLERLGSYAFCAARHEDRPDLVDLKATRNPDATHWSERDWSEANNVDYHNQFHLETGRFDAITNWGDKDENKYGKVGRLPNSEVIFAQVRQALALGAQGPGQGGGPRAARPGLTSIKRSRIVNPDALIALMHTAPASFDRTLQGSGTLEGADRQAALGTPNGLPVYFLIAQHAVSGDDTHIEKVELDGQSLIFELAQVLWDLESHPLAPAPVRGRGGLRRK